MFWCWISRGIMTAAFLVSNWAKHRQNPSSEHAPASDPMLQLLVTTILQLRLTSSCPPQQKPPPHHQHSHNIVKHWTKSNDHIYRMVKESNSNIWPNHCIWPIRTHYTFVSTNEQFAPNEDDLTMVQRPSTITILYIWSLLWFVMMASKLAKQS